MLVRKRNPETSTTLMGQQQHVLLGQLCPRYLRSLRATEAEHHGRPRVVGGTRETQRPGPALRAALGPVGRAAGLLLGPAGPRLTVNIK